MPVHLIEPKVGNPGAGKTLLYPKHIARVRLDFKRLGLSPRVFQAVVVVDACTGKAERADVFPGTVLFQSETATVIPPRVDAEEARQILDAYARRRFGRRFLTYWPPRVSVEYSLLAYKAFWVLSAGQDETHLLDSLTGKRMSVRGAIQK